MRVMSRARAWKRLQKPHVALLLLLAFGLGAQSIIGFASQMHEVLLHAEAGETYAHQHAPHAHEEDGGEDGQHRSAFHGLLHQPCGGHGGWMAGPQIVLEVPARGAGAAPEPPFQPVHASGLTTPFRPPKHA